MSTKRKTRSQSSSVSTSSISSPEEKKCREASVGSEERDEVFQALNMAEDLGSKIEEVLMRLKKLDNIEHRLMELSSTLSNIEETISRLDSDVSTLKAKNTNLEKTVYELKEGVNLGEEDISVLKTDMKKNEFEIEELRKQILYMEAYSRRENAKFIGVPEELISSEVGMEQDRPSQKTENTKEVIYKFMEEHLQIEHASDRIEFQRIHRLGKPVSGKSRPIIARFLRYKDKVLVMEQARKLLKGKEFSMFDDIPKELYDSRKKQIKKLKEARRNGLNAYFSKAHPDKLFVEGRYVAPDEPLS